MNPTIEQIKQATIPVRYTGNWEIDTSYDERFSSDMRIGVIPVDITDRPDIQALAYYIANRDVDLVWTTLPDVGPTPPFILLYVTWAEPKPGALAIWVPAYSQWVKDAIQRKQTGVALILGTHDSGGVWRPMVLPSTSLYMGIPFDWDWESIAWARDQIAKYRKEGTE